MSATSCISDLQELIRERDGAKRIVPFAGNSKPALSRPGDDVMAVDISELRGIVEYDPAELTVTALAATPVAEVSEALGQHGQYLPFDPPLVHSGATLGGAVAAATSGSNAFRHGGVRDFAIGVRLIDGTGRLVSGGGKVVKNAAGFDLPKLMVGSRGRLGVMTQLSFKVFPRPVGTITHRYRIGLDRALTTTARLCRGPFTFDAVDIEPNGHLVVRLGGQPDVIHARSARLTDIVGASVEVLEGEEEHAYWVGVSEFAWIAAGHAVVRVPLPSSRLQVVDKALKDAGGCVRFSLAGNVAWVAWPPTRPVERLDDLLAGLALTGVALTGPPIPRPLGIAHPGGAFGERVRTALDPFSRFAED